MEQGNDEQVPVLWRAVVLLFASRFPEGMRRIDVAEAVPSLLEEAPSAEDITATVAALIAEGILVEGPHGKMAIVPSDEVLGRIARHLLEYDEGIAFMSSPYVASLVDLSFFRRHAEQFKTSVASMPPELRSYLDCEGGGEEIDRLYDAMVDDLLSTVGIRAHPEILFWVLYPDEMVRRIGRVYDAIGSEGMDEALRDE